MNYCSDTGNCLTVDYKIMSTVKQECQYQSIRKGKYYD